MIVILIVLFFQVVAICALEMNVYIIKKTEEQSKVGKELDKLAKLKDINKH